MVQEALRDLHKRIYTKRMQTLEKKGRDLQGSLGPRHVPPPNPQHINQEPDEIPFEIPQISVDFSGVWIRLQTQNKS